MGVASVFNSASEDVVKRNLRELYNYRDLLVMFARRDIKVRYKQSVMGLLWAILMPTVIVGSGILVRYAYAIATHKALNLGDMIAVTIKSIPWAFFISSIRFSCISLTTNSNLVTKVYFPKEVFPLAAVVAQLFDLCVVTLVLIPAFVIFRLELSLQLLWIGPLMVVMVMLAAGTGLLLSAGSVFFRDVKYIVEILLSFGIFVTPVFYDVSMLGQKGRWLLLNPVAPILEAFAAIIRGQSPDGRWVVYSFAVATTMLICGYLIFKRTEASFAESI